MSSAQCVFLQSHVASVAQKRRSTMFFFYFIIKIRTYFEFLIYWIFYCCSPNHCHTRSRQQQQQFREERKKKKVIRKREKNCTFPQSHLKSQLNRMDLENEIKETNFSLTFIFCVLDWDGILRIYNELTSI